MEYQTVLPYLEGQFYSVKKVLPQPSAMNSAENKEKRSNYVGSVMESIGHWKRIVYIDETSCNHLLRRSFGRSKKGDISQTEYRLRHLEDLIDSSICKITPTLCMKTCNHVQRHFQSCLALMDLNMGDICNQ